MNPDMAWNNFFRWFAVVFGWEVLTRGSFLYRWLICVLWKYTSWIESFRRCLKKRRTARICNKHDKCISSLLDRLHIYVFSFKISSVYSSKWLLNYTHTNVLIKNATSFTVKPLCYCKYIFTYPTLLLYFLIEKRASHASLILK